MLKLCIAIYSLTWLQVVLAGDLEDFLAFCAENGKKYLNEVEESQRFNNFLQNRDTIMRHNRGFDVGVVTYEMETNRFTDLAYEEFLRLYTGFKMERRDSQNFGQFFQRFFKLLSSSFAIFRSSFDWRDQKAVSPVKDQRQCGSCWAFAATGALEAQIYIKTKRSVLLSEQHLVDCTLNNTKNFGIYQSYGCGGGYPSNAFNYIRDNCGLMLESSYPYEAKNMECRFNSTNSVDAKSTRGYLGILPEETFIKMIVTNIGPVAVAMHVSEKFIYYKSGIYIETDCSRMLNHAVLIVGYGSENGRDFWIVKNSWGVDWGEAGYFRISRGTNECGIAQYATYPLYD